MVCCLRLSALACCLSCAPIAGARDTPGYTCHDHWVNRESEVRRSVASAMTGGCQRGGTTPLVLWCPCTAPPLLSIFLGCPHHTTVRAPRLRMWNEKNDVQSYRMSDKSWC